MQAGGIRPQAVFHIKDNLILHLMEYHFFHNMTVHCITCWTTAIYFIRFLNGIGFFKKFPALWHTSYNAEHLRIDHSSRTPMYPSHTAYIPQTPAIIFLQYYSYFMFSAHMSVSSPASIPLFGTVGFHIPCSVSYNFEHLIHIQIEIKPYAICHTGSTTTSISGV